MPREAKVGLSTLKSRLSLTGTLQSDLSRPALTGVMEDSNFPGWVRRIFEGRLSHVLVSILYLCWFSGCCFCFFFHLFLHFSLPVTESRMMMSLAIVLVSLLAPDIL